jgi:hypothetical protein
MSKLLKAANEIEKSGRHGKANYIHLSEEFIQKQADKREISFDKMCRIIENELKPK